MSKGPKAEGVGLGGQCDQSVGGEKQGWREKQGSEQGPLVNPAKDLELNPEQNGSS